LGSLVLAAESLVGGSGGGEGRRREHGRAGKPPDGAVSGFGVHK
jgi:hypothetical protein